MTRSPNTRRSSFCVFARRLVLTCFALLGLSALAGLLPFKFLKQLPRGLQGDYFLLLKAALDKAKPTSTNAPPFEVFTNALPFATFFSNRVVTAAGATRPIKRVIQVTEKGTNVYMVSFQDKSSWIITQADLPDKWVVLEPTKTNARTATTFVISRNPTNDIPTNKPAVP